MKTFEDFLQQQRLVENEALQKFLKDNGLEDEWVAFRKKPKPVQAPPEDPKGWKPPKEEGMRKLNAVIKTVIDRTVRVNKFGIDDIKFEVINSEETSTGMQYQLEAQGTAHARNADHIKRQLERLLSDGRQEFQEQGIHMEIMYNTLDVSEAVEETSMDEPAIGLVRKYQFRVLAKALVTTRDQPNDRT